MNLRDFFSRARDIDLQLQLDSQQVAPPTRLSNEAMFHLPLIAITILMISKGHVKPTVEGIGQTVGDCFERTFAGFRGSAQHLGWSASLRVRTVQALSFLESAKLVEVNALTRKIAATSLGRSVVERAVSVEGELAASLVGIEHSYRNIRVERQLRLVPA